MCPSNVSLLRKLRVFLLQHTCTLTQEYRSIVTNKRNVCARKRRDFLVAWCAGQVRTHTFRKCVAVERYFHIEYASVQLQEETFGPRGVDIGTHIGEELVQMILR